MALIQINLINIRHQSKKSQQMAKAVLNFICTLPIIILQIQTAMASERYSVDPAWFLGVYFIQYINSSIPRNTKRRTGEPPIAPNPDNYTLNNPPTLLSFQDESFSESLSYPDLKPVYKTAQVGTTTPRGQCSQVKKARFDGTPSSVPSGCAAASLPWLSLPWLSLLSFYFHRHRISSWSRYSTLCSWRGPGVAERRAPPSEVTIFS